MATSPSDDIHIRMPRKLKRDALKVFEANGLDVSSAIRLFFMHTTMQGTVPLPRVTVNGFTPEFEASLLKQIRNPDIVATLETAEDIEKYINDL
ncbi:hypothetical protein EXS70_01485 [Candidatus Peribacteria bacterium]|nr:hypothetical protein [Candidatus Peribacteria bacterium]